MFNEKVILITGGSSGIGKSTVLLFASKGARVVFTYKSNKRGALEVLEQINQMSEGIAIQADLVNEKDAKNVVENAMNRFGKIDVLINNAGRYIEGDEWNGSSEIFVKSLEQNLVSMMNVSKYVIPVFLENKYGNIVSVASRYSIDGQPEAIAYAAAKAGVVNITQAYAKLLSPFGRANCISPSAVQAGYWLNAPQEEIDDQNKLIDPEKVAEKIVFLASDEAVDVNAQNVLIAE